MTKTKKLIAILVVLAMVFSFVFAIAACTEPHECSDVCETCGGCLNPDCEEDACQPKCQGHGVVETHTCKHVCETCGKCKDATCTNAACAEKCPGHQIQGDEHECKHVCETCEKCTDTTCTDAACAEKCPGHGGEENQFGTLEDPVSVTDALAVISDLGSGEYTSADNHYYVKGVVTRVTYTGSTYSFYIVDASGSDELCCYYIYLGSGVAAPAKNDIVTVSGRLVNYNGTTPEITTQSGDTTKATLQKNERGTSNITKVENEGTHIVLGQESGKNGDTFSFTVTVDEGYTLTSVKVGTDNATHVEGDNYTGIINGDTVVTANAIKPQEGETTVNFDFVTGFGSTWATDWSGYAEKTVAGSAVGATGADFTVVFSRVSKQSGTITDRPVIAANNSTVYVTFTLAGGQNINSASFELKQWGSKVFHTLTIEYFNGSSWTAVSGCGFVGASSASFLGSLSAESLPEGVTAVRLAIGTTTSSNTQIALTSASITVK